MDPSYAGAPAVFQKDYEAGRGDSDEATSRHGPYGPRGHRHHRFFHHLGALFGIKSNEEAEKDKIERDQKMKNILKSREAEEKLILEREAVIRNHVIAQLPPAISSAEVTEHVKTNFGVEHQKNVKIRDISDEHCYDDHAKLDLLQERPDEILGTKSEEVEKEKMKEIFVQKEASSSGLKSGHLLGGGSGLFDEGGYQESVIPVQPTLTSDSSCHGKLNITAKDEEHRLMATHNDEQQETISTGAQKTSNKESGHHDHTFALQSGANNYLGSADGLKDEEKEIIEKKLKLAHEAILKEKANLEVVQRKKIELEKTAEKERSEFNAMRVVKIQESMKKEFEQIQENAKLMQKESQHRIENDKKRFKVANTAEMMQKEQEKPKHHYSTESHQLSILNLEHQKNKDKILKEMKQKLDEEIEEQEIENMLILEDLKLDMAIALEKEKRITAKEIETYQYQK